jgi:hypothetical protein
VVSVRLFGLIGFLFCYCLIGFGFYKLCRVLAEKVMFFDLIDDIVGLDDDSGNLGRSIWITCWPIFAPLYLMVSSFIFLTSSICAVGLVAWIKLFPKRTPKGFA